MLLYSQKFPPKLIVQVQTPPLHVPTPPLQVAFDVHVGAHV